MRRPAPGQRTRGPTVRAGGPSGFPMLVARPARAGPATGAATLVEVPLPGRRVVVVVGVVEHDGLPAQDEEMPPVGPGEDVRVEDQGGGAVGDDGPVDGRDLLEPLRRAGQVV